MNGNVGPVSVDFGLSRVPTAHQMDMSVAKPAGTIARSGVEVTRGSENPADAAIAVIVMAVDADRRALAAVHSIIDQSVSAEIVLVNTGAASLASWLPAEVMRRITLVESGERRYPGGTRNLGIAHSRAPIVAFLAADCVAQPGWLHARMLAHESGYDLVASSVRPKVDHRGAISTASWASYVLIHFHRAPRTTRKPNSVLFGLSYRREVLERHGPFDETVRVSEDLQLNRMLRDKGYRAQWDRAIVTLHGYEPGLVKAVLDQFGRGRRSAQYARYTAHTGLLAHFRMSWCRNRMRIAAARVSRDDFNFGKPHAVLWTMRLLCWAQALGVLSSIVGRRPWTSASGDR
jgi:GT2 family glycosyltransferase